MKRFLVVLGVGLFLCAPAQAATKRPTLRQAWNITAKTIRAHQLDATLEGCVTYGKHGRGCFYTFSEDTDPDPNLVVGAVIVRVRDRRLQCSDDWHRGWHRCPR